MKDWFVYILECCDGTFYTGVSNNVEKRVALHNLKKGAKYTRGRTPVVLRYVEKLSNKGEALMRECEIKSLSRTKKESLW